MRFWIGFIIVGLLFIGACGGDDNARILHLRGADISENDYRTATRAMFFEAPAMAERLCQASKGLSYQEVIALVQPTGTPPPLEAKGATPIPDQLPEPASQKRAVAILLEECHRISD